MTSLLLYDHPASICSQMARLALAEKGIRYERRTVDIMESAEQFEPWYVALDPQAEVADLKVRIPLRFAGCLPVAVTTGFL